MTQNDNLAVFCDFDGTISTSDIVDFLLEELADPEWRTIEEQWERGEISAKECMGRQIPLIRGGWKAIRELLIHVKLDPTFPSFVQWCRLRSIPVFVVSDGLDQVISHLMQREGVEVDAVWSNRLLERESGELHLNFSVSPIYGSCGAGVCKCGIANHIGGTARRVIIGDGRSDFCWAEQGDIVFAKSKLATHLTELKTPFIEFKNFADIQSNLESLTFEKSWAVQGRSAMDE